MERIKATAMHEFLYISGVKSCGTTLHKSAPNIRVHFAYKSCPPVPTNGLGISLSFSYVGPPDFFLSVKPQGKSGNVTRLSLTVNVTKWTWASQIYMVFTSYKYLRGGHERCQESKEFDCSPPSFLSSSQAACLECHGIIAFQS